ncbi:MAG: hypothetical protein COT74_00225 [Bdellovibrionales bacterium CG10_big_fil_rev_8_21_14_0_10_45_34]|nr:MAG: hypothetical protein COT74_00225 [Bdellovibrionales bacterium CG10_big_fil_rev_8_21_14_0_10_45_34]
MKISVSVKTNSKVESVEKQNDGSYIVRVHVPPVDGKANERIRELLSKHFGLPKSSVELVSGVRGKKKIFSLEYD